MIQWLNEIDEKEENPIILGIVRGKAYTDRLIQLGINDDKKGCFANLFMDTGWVELVADHVDENAETVIDALKHFQKSIFWLFDQINNEAVQDIDRTAKKSDKRTMHDPPIKEAPCW